MSISPHSRVVLGFCPEVFRADRTFLFAPVVAELNNGSWFRLGNASMTYPPAGTIFVPPELYPPLFRHRDLAAWAVEDQPHFSEAGLGARFRAIHLAEGPIEVVQVSLPSTSPDVRHLLMEEGVNSVTDRSDRSALLEFQDDWMVLVRLSEHPSNAHRSIVAAGTPAFPLPAWPPGKSPSTQALTIEHHTRRVATLHNLPKSPEALDFATLEEALTSARGGGLGAIHTVPADRWPAPQNLVQS